MLAGTGSVNYVSQLAQFAQPYEKRSSPHASRPRAVPHCRPRWRAIIAACTAKASGPGCGIGSRTFSSSFAGGVTCLRLAPKTMSSFEPIWKPLSELLSAGPPLLVTGRIHFVTLGITKTSDRTCR